MGSIIKSARDIMRKDKGLSGELDRLPMLTWIMFLKFLDDTERVREEEAILSGARFRPTLEPPYRWRDWAAQEDGISGPELLKFVNQDSAVRPDGSAGPGLFAYLRSLQGAAGGAALSATDYAEELEHLPPEQLADAILEKEQHIAALMQEIRQVLGGGMHD
jgi:type I restriction enzyme M protein